jgi:hypothetical protein
MLGGFAVGNSRRSVRRNGTWRVWRSNYHRIWFNNLWRRDRVMVGAKIPFGARVVIALKPNPELVEVGSVRQRAVALAILLRQSAAAGDTRAIASAADVLDRMRKAGVV